MEKSILFDSIKYNLSELSNPDSSCQEIINLRNKHSEWKTMYPPKQFLNKSAIPNIKDFSLWHLHQVNGKDNYWYFYNGKVFYINSEQSEPTEIIVNTQQVENTITSDYLMEITRLILNGKSMTLTINGISRTFSFVLNPDSSGLQLSALWIPNFPTYYDWMDNFIAELNASPYIEPYFQVANITVEPDNPPILFIDKGINSISATINDVILSFTAHSQTYTYYTTENIASVDIKKIASFGNYIILNSETDSFYFRYDFDTDTYIKLKDLQHGRYSFGERETELIASSQNDLVDTDSENYFTDCQTEIKKRISLVNKKGKAQGHTFYIVAFRTLGNEFIFPSAPIYNYLGVPQTRAKTDWWFNTWLGGGGSGIIYFNWGTTTEFRLQPYQIGVNSVNGVLVYGFFAGNFAKPMFNYQFSLEQLEVIKSYGSLITGVCVFMSKPYYDRNFFCQKEQMLYDYTFPDNDNIDNLFELTSSFYLVHEIDPVNMAGIAGIPIEIDDFEGIETKQALPVDNATHHKMIAKHYYDFNSRLHLANITTKLGDGFNLTIPDKTESYHIPNFGYNHASYFSDDPQNVWAVVTLKTENGTKKVLHKYYDVALTKDAAGNYFVNASSFICYPDSRATSISFIKIDQGQFQYYSKFLFSTHLVDNVPAFDIIIDLPAVFHLKTHPYLNLAFYAPSREKLAINGSRYMPLEFLSDVTNYYHSIFQYTKIPLTATEPLTESVDNRLVFDYNRVQVSDLNNPILFPAINSYRIGDANNEINGIISQAIPLSTGQFGHYPIYVFSKFGIFTLQQGNNEVLYASIQPLSQDICNNPSSIVAIKGGVFYAAIDGLKVISGTQITNVSNVLDGKFPENIQQLEKFTDIITYDGSDILIKALTTVDFNLYLENAIIGYDNENDEIWICNTEELNGLRLYPYSYIFNVKTSSWYKSTSYFNHFIQTKEFLTALRDGVFYNTALFDVAPTYVLIASQPIKFDNLGLKQIERLLLRAKATDEDFFNKVICVFASLDGQEWEFINGARYKSAKQLSIKNLSVSAKYFIMVYTSFDLETTITQLDVQYHLKIKEKLR